MECLWIYSFLWSYFRMCLSGPFKRLCTVGIGSGCCWVCTSPYIWYLYIYIYIYIYLRVCQRISSECVCVSSSLRLSVTSYAAERMSLLYAEMAVLNAASFLCVSHVFFSLVFNVFLYQICVCFIWNECYSVFIILCCSIHIVCIFWCKF